MADKKKNPLVVVGLVVLALVAGALFVNSDFFKDLTNNNDLTDNVELSQQEKEELAFFLKYTTFLEKRLSPDTQDSLVTVVDYVKENPESLNEEKGLVLPDLVDVALAKVKLELVSEMVDWGEAEAPDDSDTTEDTNTTEDSDTSDDTDTTTDDSNDAVAGEQVVITGILEDYAGENPFGATYMITDQTTGVTYYFAFGETTVDNINSQSMVGQVVDITVEMTGEGQEFTVVSGPTLAVPEDTTGDEVEDSVDDTNTEESENM